MVSISAGLARVRERRRVNWAEVRSTLLTVGGLGMLSFAAWGWHHLVGYAAAGASLLVIEFLTSPGPRR